MNREVIRINEEQFSIIIIFFLSMVLSKLNLDRLVYSEQLYLFSFPLLMLFLRTI